MRKELSFDGFGINGPDEFRSRLATMVRLHTGTYTQTQIDHYGKLFENAPEMLALLRAMYSERVRDLCGEDGLWPSESDMLADSVNAHWRTMSELLKEFPQ